MISIGLLGASGRMGTKITELLSSQFAKSASLKSGASQGDSLDSLFKADVIVDFSSPDATMELIDHALKIDFPPAFVIGTTGWKDDHHRQLDLLSERAPVFISANFSKGVLAMASVLKKIAPALEGLGFRPQITETHHTKKKDAPSGTAILLKKACQNEKILINSIREGDVIGLHEVVFEGLGEALTFRHEAKDRAIFAHGAIEAAIWLGGLKKKNPHLMGYISAEDFLKGNAKGIKS